MTYLTRPWNWRFSTMPFSKRRNCSVTLQLIFILASIRAGLCKSCHMHTGCINTSHMNERTQLYKQQCGLLCMCRHALGHGAGRCRDSISPSVLQNSPGAFSTMLSDTSPCQGLALLLPSQDTAEQTDWLLIGRWQIRLLLGHEFELCHDTLHNKNASVRNKGEAIVERMVIIEMIGQLHKCWSSEC